MISIHAPPRGATNSPLSPSLGKKFQFTPLREGRRCSGRYDVCRYYFNSRPSARGDITSQGAYPSVSNFNSRPSARGDALQVDVAAVFRLFQFTPLREGRLARASGRGNRQLFQFTPLREGRPGTERRAICPCISIHAPPRGATIRVTRSSRSVLFQFTPLREGRRDVAAALSD